MRVVIVGAGVSGLCAAQQLQNDGHDVVVLDKGRGVGGRMATRRIGGAVVDHGAQFFTIRTDRFASLTAAARRDGLIFEWCTGFETDDGHPRYAVRGGMTAWMKHLADGIDVRCGVMAFAVRRHAHGWEVVDDSGHTVRGHAVILTCPLPQAFSLVVDADVDVPEPLWRTQYDRTLALLAVLGGPSAVAEPGGLQRADGFTFVADNLRKGISDVTALTVHADPQWSEAHWDDDPAAVLGALTEKAAEFIGGAPLVERQLKRWRYATPRSIWPEPCWQAADGTPVVFAGDAFDGPRVEGAAMSGLAAAAAVQR
jgi:renalase